MYNTLATIIILIICFIIAPFMTISMIFLFAGWGIIGKVLFLIFFIIGIIHMLYKINKN